jgi:hypothetical protein
MKAVMKLLGVAAVLSTIILLPAPAEAKPGYCNNPGQCPLPNGDVCTCPPGTYNSGLITDCGSYYGGICDGIDS